MDNNKKKYLKKSDKSKDKNQNQDIVNIDDKLFIYLKQNWDIIENDYDSLIKKMNKFTEYLKESEIKDEYKLLISLFSNLKNKMKNIYFNVGINIGNISINHTEKINFSYDNIYNEMTDLESAVKDINNIQNQIKKNKKIKIQNLENTLHEFMDEVESFDFNNIEKYYNLYNSNNQDEIEKILFQNNFTEKYNNKKVKSKNQDYENNLLKINTLNHDSDIINEIK